MCELMEELNPAQRLAVHRLENFGWELSFIRHPLFLDPVIVMMGPDGQKTGVLEEDGSFNTEVDIVFREG